MSDQIVLELYLKFEFGDKGFNLQFSKLSEDDKRSIYGFVRTDALFEPVKAFFQGDSDDWLMIEFWEGSPDQKREATEALVNHLGKDRVNSDDLWKLDFIGD